MSSPTLGFNLALEVNSPGPGSNPNAPFVAQAVNFISFAALAAQTWELMVSLADEVEYIWRGHFTLLKALYIGSRYGMLTAQLINQILSFYVKGHQPAPSPLCLGIFIYKAVISQMGLALVEVVLLVQVYTLYNRSFHAKRVLSLVFITTTILESIGNSVVIRSLPSGPVCMPVQVDRQGIMIFGLGAGLCQFVVFFTTLAKFYGAGRAGWTRTPLTSLMLKEGAAAFILIFTLLSIMIAYEVVQRIDIQVENAAFSWHIALLSITASRLLLNMRKVIVVHLLCQPSEEDGLFFVRSYDSAQDESVGLTVFCEKDTEH